MSGEEETGKRGPRVSGGARTSGLRGGTRAVRVGCWAAELGECGVERAVREMAGRAWERAEGGGVGLLTGRARERKWAARSGLPGLGC